MKTRIAAWSIFGVCVVLAVSTAALVLLNLETPTPRYLSLGSKAIELIFPLAAVSFAAVGVLIVLAHPANRVGWVYLAVGVSAEALILAEQYGLYAVITSPGRVPAGALVIWLASWIWAPVSALLPLLIAIYPDGRLPGPRWRFVVWCAAAGSALQGLSDALHDRVDAGSVVVSNPLGLALGDEARFWLYVVATIVWSVAMLGAVLALVARYREAPQLARQQIKWFVYAGIPLSILVVCTSFVYGSELGDILSAASALAVTAIPVATAFAILRYRLYDIDLLINRTVVYGATSAAIAATFWVGLIALQPVLRFLTAGSEITVAASTLVSFALFQPVRRRVQYAVDRRFDRSRYDAARTLDAFADRLGDEVDLDELRVDLIGAVKHTMAPAHASLWLRERPS